MLHLLNLFLLRQYHQISQLPNGTVQSIFKNQIDHFNPLDNSTYDQHFFENLNYVTNDGFTIAIVYIGGELPLLSSHTILGSYWELGKRLNAAIFALEHRYFGDSQPFTDLSTEHFRYLTIDQALADLANFISHVVLNHPQASTTQKVRIGVVGGSYPGALSSWFRMKYPQFAYASWSSSAPVYIKNNFTEYDDYVADQLRLYSEECAANSRQVFNDAEALMKQNITKFREDFGFDETEEEDDMTYALTDTFVSMIQYDSKLRLIPSFCDSQKVPSYENLVSIVKKITTLLNQTVQECDLMNQLDDSLTSPYASSRAWSYITCNEVGWFQTATGHLRPDSINLQYFEKVCKKLFNIEHLPDEREKNQYFGGKNPHQTKIFFVTSDVDPWSSIAIQTPDGNLMRHALVIANQSHCSDLYGIDESDPEPLKNAKEEIISQMVAWLSDWNCTDQCIHGKCVVNGCICDYGYGGDKCDEEIVKKESFDAAIILSISIPVVLSVIIIFISAFFFRKGLIGQTRM